MSQQSLILTKFVPMWRSPLFIDMFTLQCDIDTWLNNHVFKKWQQIIMCNHHLNYFHNVSSNSLFYILFIYPWKKTVLIILMFIISKCEMSICYCMIFKNLFHLRECPYVHTGITFFFSINYLMYVSCKWFNFSRANLANTNILNTRMN